MGRRADAKRRFSEVAPDLLQEALFSLGEHLFEDLPSQCLWQFAKDPFAGARLAYAVRDSVALPNRYVHFVGLDPAWLIIKTKVPCDPWWDRDGGGTGKRW